MSKEQNNKVKQWNTLLELYNSNLYNMADRLNYNLILIIRRYKNIDKFIVDFKN